MKLLFIAAFLFCSVNVFGQDDSLTRWKKNVFIDFSISGRNFGINIAAGYGMEKGKHHLSFGPLFISYDRRSELELVGIKFNYAFYPGEKQKTVNFYFNYDFLLQRIIMMEGSYREHVLTFFENYIGYGFKIKTLNHLYITQGAGLGYVFVHTNDPTEEDIYTVSYHKNIASGIIKLGVEYYFD